MMKKELEPLESISENIFKITQECAKTIDHDSEDGKVVYQSLKKLSEKIMGMRLKIINKEEL